MIQYQYLYIACIFCGLQHTCLCSQMFLCRVLLHCVMGTHAKELYYWHFSEFLVPCQKTICCVKRRYAVFGKPGWCKICETNLSCQCSLHCFSLRAEVIEDCNVCYGVHNFHYILTVFNFVDITSKFPAVFLSATCRTGIVEMFMMCLRNLDLNMCFVGPLFCSFTFYQKGKKILTKVWCF